MHAELREDGVQVEPFNQFPPATYADLLEDIGEMILYGVLGDVEGLRDLLGGGGPANGQANQAVLPLAGPGLP